MPECRLSAVGARGHARGEAWKLAFACCSFAGSGTSGRTARHLLPRVSFGSCAVARSLPDQVAWTTAKKTWCCSREALSRQSAEQDIGQSGARAARQAAVDFPDGSGRAGLVVGARWECERQATSEYPRTTKKEGSRGRVRAQRILWRTWFPVSNMTARWCDRIHHTARAPGCDNAMFSGKVFRMVALGWPHCQTHGERRQRARAAL